MNDPSAYFNLKYNKPHFFVIAWSGREHLSFVRGAFRLVKVCEATVQRLALMINAIAEVFGSFGVYARSALIDALSLRVAGPDLK